MFFSISRRALLLLALLLTINLRISSEAKAGPVINGGFETGDFTGWSTTGSTNVNTLFSPPQGIYAAQLTAGAVYKTNLESFLGLGAGSIDAVAGVSTTYGSAIKQTITANAGDTLSFQYRFQAADYLPFNDTGFYSLVSAQGAQLLDQVSTVGNYGDSGWKLVSYTFTTSGTYTLGYGVVNGIDNQLNSTLRVDDVSLSAVPEASTMLGFGGLLGAGGFAMLRSRRLRKTN